MEYHYVYRLELPETGEFYFGSRTCKCNPIEDNYMGSMRTWNPEKSKLVKTILKDGFLNRKSAIEYESILINQNISNALNRNYYIPTTGFHTLGRKHSDETKKKLSSIVKLHFETMAPNKYNEFVSTMQMCTKGEKNGFYGKKHSKESKDKMVNSHPYTTKGKTFVEYFGDKKAKEISLKLSSTKVGSKNPAYGKIWIHNKLTFEKKLINKSNPIPDGWMVGMGKK
jgi:hypothetical protein